MPNYNESSITGSEYTRCFEVRIANQLGAVPIIEYREQKITTLSNGRVMTDKGETLQVVYDANAVIPMRDPATGNLTGASTSFADVYNILYSAYIAEAEARDAAIAAQSS